MFGPRGSLGVCSESDSPSGGHVGWRGTGEPMEVAGVSPQEINTRHREKKAHGCLIGFVLKQRTVYQFILPIDCAFVIKNSG